MSKQPFYTLTFAENFENRCTSSPDPFSVSFLYLRNIEGCLKVLGTLQYFKQVKSRAGLFPIGLRQVIVRARHMVTV